MTGAADAIIKFLRLTFLRPVERFLAQWLSVSTEPTAFVRERIRLGDTTNFLRAVGFFFYYWRGSFRGRAFCASGISNRRLMTFHLSGPSQRCSISS